MKRIIVFAYGLTCYLIFFATFLYAIGFIGDFLVPKTIDGTAQLPLTQALLIDLGLLGLFALQHSVMARQGFKRLWTRVIPQAAERSTYVLFSSIALLVLFVFWQPLGGMIWELESTTAQTVLYSLYGFGWGLVLYASFLINHFDLFGLRQVWLHLRDEQYRQLRFATPGPYRLVRHPLYVGWLFVFWATPVMTVTHLLFALGTTAYILLAIPLEERDLMRIHGEDYRSYRHRVPMLLPRMRRSNAAPPSQQQAPSA